MKSWDKYKAEMQTEPRVTTSIEVIVDLKDKLETAERRIRELEAKIESLSNDWEKDAL